MRKIFMLAIMIACAAPLAFGQDDYNKYDVFIGYSHNRVDIGIADDDPDFDDIVDEREGFHGVNLSAKGNVSRYVGLKADYAFHRKSFQFGGVGGFDVDANLHTLVGGVEFKDNAKETRVKPFAHLMAGVGHSRVEVEAVDLTESNTGFSAVIGGGLDFRVSDRVDFRAVQFDYNPTRLDGETQHNFRIGIGVVFR
jgi:opacity protein-like surface antigen